MSHLDVYGPMLFDVGLSVVPDLPSTALTG